MNDKQFTLEAIHNGIGWQQSLYQHENLFAIKHMAVL